MNFPFFNRNRKKSQTLEESSLERDHQSLKKPHFIATRLVIPLFSIVLLSAGIFYLKQALLSIRQAEQILQAQQTEILSILNDLSSQLTALKNERQPIAEMNHTLSQLVETLQNKAFLSEVAKSSDIQAIALQLKQLQATPVLKKHPMHKMQSQKPVLQSLPFTVNSVDRISGQSFVIVTYHHELLPLNIKDALAGWTLIKIDDSTGSVVWEDEKTHQRMTTIVSRITDV